MGSVSLPATLALAIEADAVREGDEWDCSALAAA